MQVLKIGQRKRYREAKECPDFVTMEEALPDDVVVLMKLPSHRGVKCYVLLSLCKWLVMQASNRVTPSLPETRHEVSDVVYRKILNGCKVKHPDEFLPWWENHLSTLSSASLRRYVETLEPQQEEEEQFFTLDEIAAMFSSDEEQQAVESVLQDMSAEEVMSAIRQVSSAFLWEEAEA